MKRVKSKKIHVGSVSIGGDSPISVQTMTNTDTSDIKSTVAQILECEQYGVDLVRCAINTRDDAKAIVQIKKSIHVPIIADIQYDYNLAMWALENGADCIRTNPGNMKNKNDLKRFISTLKETSIPIRIGVNSGSLSKECVDKFGGVNADALVYSAIKETEFLEDLGFTNFKVAIKSSNIETAVEAYRKYSDKKNYPLHLGITESGTYYDGSIKSAIGIGSLLLYGIGDTIRVSLTDEPYKEVIAGQTILRSLGLNSSGINLISCPTCSRTNGDMISFVKEFKLKSPKINNKITVAIMGCHVNGPGEAREADIGLAFNKGSVVLFKKGHVVENLKWNHALEVLLREIKEMDERISNDR